MSDESPMGQSVARVDAIDKVTGAARYVVYARLHSSIESGRSRIRSGATRSARLAESGIMVSPVVSAVSVELKSHSPTSSSQQPSISGMLRIRGSAGGAGSGLRIQRVADRAANTSTPAIRGGRNRFTDRWARAGPEVLSFPFDRAGRL